MAGSSFLMERQQEQKLRDSFSIFRVSLFSMYLMDEMI